VVFSYLLSIFLISREGWAGNMKTEGGSSRGGSGNSGSNNERASWRIPESAQGSNNGWWTQEGWEELKIRNTDPVTGRIPEAIKGLNVIDTLVPRAVTLTAVKGQKSQHPNLESCNTCCCRAEGPCTKACVRAITLEGAISYCLLLPLTTARS
jgi:hypothetical protein